MHSTLNLQFVGIVLGLLLILTHLFALRREQALRDFLTAFPRSRILGILLLTIDLIWMFGVVTKMDWGEFYHLRLPSIIALPIVFILILKYVNEFLAPRALGILMLLLAAPVLDAAFLQPPATRLLVVVLAYAWVVLGLLWVCIPHLMRDQITWIRRGTARWRLAAWTGVLYGVAMFVCALRW